MATRDLASGLIVDDQQEGNELRAFLKTKRVAAKVLHPEDVLIRDLENADLVLVDYQLESGNWPARDAPGTSISRQPRDGLALASVLRRHVHDREKTSPTAFAILTGKIEQLAAPLPPEHREHILARMNSLEWVFQKAKPMTGNQVVELATAVRKLPRGWAHANEADAVRQLAIKVLDFDPAASRNKQRVESIAACTPPIHELSRWSHGLAIMRWLLHRILPYPSFLWDSHQLAARLRVDHSWFTKSYQAIPALRKLLKPSDYTGVLAEFGGRRWWRSEIELVLWDKTGGESTNADCVRRLLQRVTKRKVTPSSPPDHPIVCVDRDYQPLERFCAIEECVRIRPDDWPSFSDQAWTPIELAQGDEQLAALVIPEDRGKLDGKAS
jgi:hypothetical protein